MNYNEKKVTIGEVVVELPEATQIFDDYGIDFCCGGHRVLADVIKEKGIDANSLFKKLEQAQEKRRSEYQKHQNNFEEMSLAVLSAYIEDTHHTYLRHALPETAELLNTILKVHGKKHKELFTVYHLFGQMKTDLEQHLLKEETMLFPDLYEVEENYTEIAEMTNEIIAEHEAVGDILRELRRVTEDYTIPDDVCNTFRKTYSMLEEIEKDLHQHIHLENNILLKDYSNRLITN